MTLPFDSPPVLLRDEVWQRWLDWDPVRMVAKHADALRGCRAIWIDAGKSDEWWLDLGAQAFRRRAGEVGVTETACISSSSTAPTRIDYRYPRSLAYLAYRLSD